MDKDEEVGGPVCITNAQSWRYESRREGNYLNTTISAH
jgi:hypothetical protein